MSATTRKTTQHLEEWDRARAAWNASRDEGQRHLMAIANGATSMGHMAHLAAQAVFTSADGLDRGTADPESLAAVTMEANAEFALYARMRRDYRSLYRCVESMHDAVEAMEAVAAALLDSPSTAQPMPRTMPPRPPEAPGPGRACHQREGPDTNKPLGVGHGGSGGGRASDNPAPALLLTHHAASLGLVVGECAALYRAQLGVCEDVAKAGLEPDAARASSATALTLRMSLWLMEPLLDPQKLQVLDRIRRTELDPMARETFLA